MKRQFLTAILALSIFAGFGCCVDTPRTHASLLPQHFGTFEFVQQGDRGTVYRGQWNGWNSLLITNGELAAVAVPELSRIMYFGPLEGPNLIWINDQWIGKTRADWPAEQRGYQNFGGFKLWTQPWLGWPPPVDGVAAQSHTIHRNGSVTVTQPPHAVAGVQISWTVGFENESLRVDCRFVNTSDQDKSYQIWSVIQTKADRGFYMLPPTPDARGYVGRQQNPVDPDNLRVEQNFIAIRPALATANWIGTNPDEGWVVYVRPMNRWSAMMICSFPASRQWDYADNVSNVIYNSPGEADEQYTEIEAFSPIQNMAPGGHMDFTMHWHYVEVDRAVEFDDNLDGLVRIIRDKAR